LVIFGFFRFLPKMNFYFRFIFRFRSKNLIRVRPKMLCSQLNRATKFCDIGAGRRAYCRLMHYRPHSLFWFRDADKDAVLIIGYVIFERRSTRR